VETHVIVQEKESQKCAFCRQSDVNTLLLKVALCGPQFAKYEEDKDVVYAWLRAQRKTYVTDGNRNIVDQEKKMCAEARGLRRKMVTCLF
jgi:hypothetical protein